jgi:hypothetical protein
MARSYNPQRCSQVFVGAGHARETETPYNVSIEDTP